MRPGRRFFGNGLRFFADSVGGIAPAYRVRVGRPGGPAVLIVGVDRRWFDFELRVGRPVISGSVSW